MELQPNESARWSLQGSNSRHRCTQSLASPQHLRCSAWPACVCRSDLEKAISSHGGPSVVAQQLGWTLKAKGRWVGGWAGLLWKGGGMAGRTQCLPAWHACLLVRPQQARLCSHNLALATSAGTDPATAAACLPALLCCRRPKGYWDSPENVRAELDEFIEEQRLPPGGSGGVAGGVGRRGVVVGGVQWLVVGCRDLRCTVRGGAVWPQLHAAAACAGPGPAGVMPAKNDFVRAGRYDIARAVERWGGLYEVRSLLCCAVLCCVSVRGLFIAASCALQPAGSPL